MSDTGQRDRSPGFPLIPLGDALQRLEQFEAHFKRTPARPDKVGEAWGISAKAYMDRTAAALRYFGLLDYQTQPTGRMIVISDEGRKYLRAQQESVKRQVIVAAALRPKQIANFWQEWGADRPADAACIDDLVLKHGFSDKGARDFLKVYDATISFAKLADSDKVPLVTEEELGEVSDNDDNPPPPPPPPPPPADRNRTGRIAMMEGERELTTGLLSKGASFRLIVSGNVGEKEIERLIRKLELDKEILADQGGSESAPRPASDENLTQEQHNYFKSSEGG